MSTPNAEKGARYLGLLDQALCNGNWSEIAELARKTEKHAPNRACLTLAARAEAQIASGSNRSGTAGSNSLNGLNALIPHLENAVSVGQSIEEDAFVAGVCLAEIYWLQGTYETALRALPEHVPQSGSLGSGTSAMGWIEVCETKARYIRGTSLQNVGKEQDAALIWRQVIQLTPGSRSPELRRWTEKLIAEACMYFDGVSRTTGSTQAADESIRAFNVWSDFWQRSSATTGGSGGSSTHLGIPRSHVWKAHYVALSKQLASDAGYAEDVPNRTSRSQQYAELNGVAETYESMLMSSTEFPKATQHNREVEDWIQQAMVNWRLFTGTSWSDADLGNGGKESVSRSMLDALYLAATKTFHSTLILRSLFNVHCSLGEFELALHAFDSYADIVSRGKARAAKTGRHELGFDDDDTAMLTAVEAIRVLCRYGDRDQAEKALEVVKDIQRWLDQQRPISSNQVASVSDDNTAKVSHPINHPTAIVLRPTTLAAAYRAFGICKAHWAALTYDTETRSGLQTEARKYFERAQTYEAANIETAYALALLLAETRDVTGAIAVIKPILADRSRHDDADLLDYNREAQLLPLWHLLSLCLSAKDQQESAVKMCEAAFEQFGEPSTLFGNTAQDNTDPEKLAYRSFGSSGVVDQLDASQKEGVIQIKMSQLRYVELIEGSTAAVDMTDELLALYARLFGSPEQLRIPKPPPTATNSMPPPSRGPGTLRSVVGSIRPKSRRSSIEKTPPTSLNSTAPPFLTNGNSTGQSLGAPIAITVTNENGSTADQARGRHEHRHHLPFHFRHSHSAKRSPSNPDSREANVATGNTASIPAAVPEHSAVQDHAAHGLDDPARTIPDVEKTGPQDDNEQQPSQDRARPQSSHLPLGGSPQTNLPTAQQRRHKIALLVKVWLFIAELYIRAEVIDDAAGAVEEAYKLVEALQAGVAATHSSARNFFFKGWGGGASVDELWADVWSAKGDLALARRLPFEAIENYEQSLTYYPDHPNSIIALSELLMDIYEEKVPAEPPTVLLPPAPSNSDPSLIAFQSPVGTTTTPASSRPTPRKSKDPDPAQLNRLAARDRAYLLLSTLTRLGTGWDNSEAWLALARNHELSGQVAKAKEALWWVVELEEARPVREWRVAAVGGYTL